MTADYPGAPGYEPPATREEYLTRTAARERPVRVGPKPTNLVVLPTPADAGTEAGTCPVLPARACANVQVGPEQPSGRPEWAPTGSVELEEVGGDDEVTDGGTPRPVALSRYLSTRREPTCMRDLQDGTGWSRTTLQRALRAAKGVKRARGDDGAYVYWYSEAAAQAQAEPVEAPSRSRRDRAPRRQALGRVPRTWRRTL